MPAAGLVSGGACDRITNEKTRGIYCTLAKNSFLMKKIRTYQASSPLGVLSFHAALAYRERARGCSSHLVTTSDKPKDKKLKGC